MNNFDGAKKRRVGAQGVTAAGENRSDRECQRKGQGCEKSVVLCRLYREKCYFCWLNIDTWMSEILYKYLDATGGLMMLYYGTLQFTNATQLNDPFDCHPALIDFSQVPPEKTRAWPADVNSLLESDRHRRYRELAYICSLSKVHDSLLMWSYYNGHKGVCIGLDMEKTRKYSSRMNGKFIGCFEWEVQYKDVVEKPDYFRNLQDFFRYQMTTKAKEWEHEQEVRLFAYDPYPEHMRLLPYQDDKKGPIDWKKVRAFLEIGGECFESVRLGINISKEDKEKIVKVARDRNPDIKIYQMTIDPDAFRLKEELIND